MTTRTLELITDQTLLEPGIFQAFGITKNYSQVEMHLRVRCEAPDTNLLSFLSLYVNKDENVANYLSIGSSLYNAGYGQDLVTEPQVALIPTNLSQSTDFASVRIITHKPHTTRFGHSFIGVSSFMYDLSLKETYNTYAALIWYSGSTATNKVTSVYFKPVNYPTNMFSAGSTLVVQGWV